MNSILILDTCGLSCPLPILKTKKILAKMNPLERVLVTATDPDSANDFQHFVTIKGHRLIESKVENSVYSFVIEKGEK